MDKFLIRKDVYGELIEKGYGKKDLSKLTKKKITDKNGHTRTVYVRNGEQPATQQQPKAQDELSPEKKARYEEMLEQVKAGPEENALFVRGKGMLSKKDAIAHLSEKLGTKTVNSAAQGHLESDTPQNTDITKEDEERFGKQALSGLSGKRTGDEEMEDSEETNKLSFEDSVKEYNFTDTKKGQFAMDEVANFYPELKDIVENRRKAFYEVDAAEKKLKVNPNNKEYKDNFASAYNKLKQADAEYDKASKKALEKAPNIKKPDFYKYMDAKRDVQKFLDKYKMQSEEYEVGQRLRANDSKNILSPMYGLKPDDYTKDPNYIKAQMIIRAYEQK
ncbi:MAG: hypothetical protein J6T31_05330 [Methanobrevibacter sp.]|nr:hypothetical protein [Methanobrevibacter sp.]